MARLGSAQYLVHRPPVWRVLARWRWRRRHGKAPAVILLYLVFDTSKLDAVRRDVEKKLGKR